jgi:DNA polymerase-3 subunit alpha
MGRGVGVSPRSFVHLHNHSQYSLLDGVSKVKDIVTTARDLKMPAVALTDHGNLFGAIPFYQAARKAGVQPILGMEAYVAPGSRHDRDPSRREKTGHLILLAQNEAGYRNLMKLSSLSFLEGFYYKPRIDRELLRQNSDGLIALSACLTGEINNHLMAGRETEAEARAKEYRDIFDGRYYLELMDNGIPQQRELIPRLVDLGRRLGIPLVATNDCHYIRRDHAEAHDVLLCIQTGKTRDDPRRRLRFQTDQMYFKSAEEMMELFSGLPEAVENTVKIAESCSLELELDDLRLPHFPCPEGFQSLDDYLAHLCKKGIKDRYADVTGDMWTRLDYELGVIRQMGYAGYFLIVQDFIAHAREQGIPVGPGRGSAAGSLVAYGLRITNIDPLRYGLIFERFLNPERVTMPDIDIDFADNDRPKVIRYVVEKYGEANVTQIITFGTMAARAVIRDVGRVLNLPYGEVDRIAKMVPPEPGMTLEKALEKSPELKETTDSDVRLQGLMRIARILEGTTRHASTHAAGIVLAPTPLLETVPLYKTNDGEVTTQYDMVACEKVGLLKIDLLGLRTLTVIKDCLGLIHQNRGATLDIEEIPIDDPEVFQLMGRGETVGVFQFESSGMVDYLRKLKPESLEDLIAMNALYRPGPLGSRMVDDFILRKQGRREISYEHPGLEPILRETNGVIVYQEQVMRIASELAGYTLGEADLLRRAMSKKKTDIMKEQKAVFLERSSQREIKRSIAEKIFEKMAYFAGYGFNRSHSAGYALIAYQTAYLKTHHPVEFMAASMTSEVSNSDRIQILLSECRRLGIEVRPPDVNKSRSGFHVDGEVIWFGLEAVKGVGHGAVEALVQVRGEEDPFRDIFHLCELVDPSAVNRKSLECLAQAGGLDSLGGSREQILAALTTAIDWGTSLRRDRRVGQDSLFAEGGDTGMSPPPLPEVESWSDRETLRREKAVLGFYLTGHPLDAYKDLVKALGLQRVENLTRIQNGQAVSMAGIVTSIRMRQDRQGRAIAFFMLDDGSSSCEAQCFADCYSSYGSFLSADQPLFVKGRVRRTEGEDARITLSEMRPLQELAEGGQLVLRLSLEEDVPEESLEQVRQALNRHPGDASVFLQVDDVRGHPVLIRLRSQAIRPRPELLRDLSGILGVSGVRLQVGGDGSGNGGASPAEGDLATQAWGAGPF